MHRYVGRLDSLQESGSGSMDQLLASFKATSHWVAMVRKREYFALASVLVLLVGSIG